MKTKVTTIVILSILMSFAAAWAGLTKTEISGLYLGIFGRTSEGESNHYWQTLGLDMSTTADVMLETDAAKNYFGDNLNTNQAFIEHIYYNTLNKTSAEDPEGIDHWVGMLDTGASRGFVVATLVSAVGDYAPDGPRYDPLDLATISAYNRFTNRVEISDYMADRVEKAPDNWAVTTSFSSIGLNVTEVTATVDTAKIIIDGFAGEDHIVGSWNFSGSRPDGVQRTGTMDFREDGSFDWTIKDADGQSDGSGTGSWSVSDGTLTLNFYKLWSGPMTSSENSFSFSTSHGIYTFSRTASF